MITYYKSKQNTILKVPTNYINRSNIMLLMKPTSS